MPPLPRGGFVRWKGLSARDDQRYGLGVKFDAGHSRNRFTLPVQALPGFSQEEIRIFHEHGMDRHPADVTTHVRRRNLAVIDCHTISAAAKNRELRYPAFDVDPALTFLELDEDTPEREVTLLGRTVLAPHGG